ncbi:hypothetical protein [Persicitalea jodogahamensis]|uniref:Uncharacterized protein n=1 Tax=Persicitalea jodogahamensis TaxID=402147 RepID=A0A8J3D5P2_9BACT|nr:hypothetical protein [Persicitalea jodogahamensis]GHB77596.1 hypothetical protein GCM10007390_34710 [Persicitalea jodogahamensis]
MNRLILGLLDLFGPLFRRMGVDYPQLRAILDVKLTMDNRRSRTGFNGQETKNSNWGFVWTLVITFAMSSFIALLVYFWPAHAQAYAVVTAYGMIIVTMILITDFSQVILDGSDGLIILTRPVTSKTLFTSRIVHAAVYLLQLALAVALPSFFATLLKFGLGAGLIFLISSLLVSILSVLFTTVLYLLIMRFSSVERMQNIINGLQIIVVILVTVGYQFIGRLIDFEDFANTKALSVAWWHYLAPPMWVGHVMSATIGGYFGVPTLLFAALLVVVPILAVRSMSGGLVRSFGNQVGNLDAVDTKKKEEVEVGPKRSVPELLSGVFTRTATERAAFELVWKIGSRDRKFKLRVYPSMAYFLIIGPLMFFNRPGETLTQMMEATAQSEYLRILLIYVSALTMVAVNQNLPFSDQFKAAWVYHVVPMPRPGEFLSGMMWSVVAKFILPIYLVVALVVTFVWGVDSLDDVILGALVVLVFQQTEILATRSVLPFSREFTKSGSGKFIRVLALSIFVGIFGWAHWALSQTSYVILVMVPFAFFLVLFLNREIRKLGWDKVEV